MTYTRYRNRASVAWIAGTPAVIVPVAAYNAYEINIDAEKSVNVPNTSTIGSDYYAPTDPAGRYQLPGFQVRLRGSGTDNVPPPEGTLFRAMGFTETANGIAFEYVLGNTHLATGSPAGSTRPVDLELWTDRLYRKMDNCVLNGIFSFESNKFVTVDVTGRGQCVAARNGGIEIDALASFVAGVNPVPVQSEAGQVTLARSAEVTGSVTGATSTTVLIDSAALFFDNGIYPGDAIAMDVGLETATVVTVDSQTQITSTALSGAGSYAAGEAYTITKANKTFTDLVIPRIICDIGNVIDPRDDINGAHGFSQAIITGRQPSYTVIVEAPSLHDGINFEYEFTQKSTFDWQWTHEAGLGVRREVVSKFSGVMNDFPSQSVMNGKIVYALTFDQAVESGDDPFTMTWKGA